MVDRSAETAPRRVWTVAALVQAVADALAARFPGCTVRGELSGYTRASSGHCYFTLKDADGGAALIRCAMFRRAASLLDFAPADGQRVELRGRLGVYEPRGELQFVVESMQRAGEGTLYEQFLRLKARLEAEGLFDAARKRALPRHPRAVGVVTSTQAAALHDVLSALARRSPHVAVVVYPSPVQGSEAPAALAAAIGLAGARAEVDTLLLCRGGGSLEDLWAFNDERVVRAIAACPIPVVCGVGHETDVTLADFAADLRAPTPTAAAELAAPPTVACVEGLAVLAAALGARLHRVLDTQATRLDAVALRLARPGANLRRRVQDLDLLAHRLGGAAAHAVERRRADLQQTGARLVRAGGVDRRWRGQRLAGLEARLRGLDPREVLSRGYAWFADEAGAAVTTVSRLAPGQALNAVLHDGRAEVVVRRVDADRPG